MTESQRRAFHVVKSATDLSSGGRVVTMMSSDELEDLSQFMIILPHVAEQVLFKW